MDEAATARKLNEAKKNDRAAAQSDQSETTPKNKTELGVIGGILFAGWAAFSIGADILPIITGGLSLPFDILISVLLGCYGYFTMLIITGDPIGALVSRRAGINFLQTLAEWIPIIAFLPLHTFAILVIWLDLKYGILDFSKNISKLP